MNTKGVAIKYGDFALGAKEDFVPDAPEKETFVDLLQLKKNNLSFPNYSNPCELYQTLLDDTSEAFPEEPVGNNFGFWSEQVCEDDGIFSMPVILEFTSENQYKSQGFSLTFDKANNIYCNHLNITWYRNGEVIQSTDFRPDNAFYFCKERVDNFNKVVMTFYSMNLPHNRLKLHVVDWGYGTVFYGDELKNVTIKQTIDPISSEIQINSCEIVLASKRDINYSFQTKQNTSIYFNGHLKGEFFVKSSKRTSKNSWTIHAEDYISIMDNTMFLGDVYTDKNAVELLTEIFNTAKVPFEIDESIFDKTVSGRIPYCTCRKALMLVAFAVCACVDTSNGNSVKVFKLSNDISQTIPVSRIKQGQSFDNGDIVTSVDLTVHKYVKPKRKYETAVLYDASESGIGQNIFVTFQDPMYDLEIDEGTILSSNANYAIIDAKGGCELSGKKYKDVSTIIQEKNDVVLVGEVENKLQINDATLVSENNAQEVLQNAAQWLMKVDTVNLDIVEGKHVTGGEYVLYGNCKYGAVKYNGKLPTNVTFDKIVNVGDLVTCETEYLGDITGRVIEQSYNLNGGIIVKKAVIK